MKRQKSIKPEVWLVTESMGYGHQRAAWPLRHIARGGIIIVNDYPGIPESDKKIFHDLESFYNSISKFKKVPIIGELAFKIYDQFQKIPPYIPGKDMSSPTFQVRAATNLILRKKWGKHLIDTLAKEQPEGKPLPFLTTFFTPAFFADLHGYPGDIFCIICDTEISRDWVAKDPLKSRIRYFVPTERAFERLKSYGVPPERIRLSGFPLPLENLGDNNFDILREDLSKRLVLLDPLKVFIKKNRKILNENKISIVSKVSRPLTITYAVGGAGAQKEIGIAIAKSFKEEIKIKKIKLVLVAGIHHNLYEYFQKELTKLDLSYAEILYEPDKYSYFEKFNKLLRTTDILWTKPSELSFYVALGIPLIMSSTIGSQEDYNQKWLLKIDAGVSMPKETDIKKWFFDILQKGRFAELALNGFLNAEKRGTLNIIESINRIEKGLPW